MPSIGRTVILTPLTARSTLSTRRRSQIPGIVLARWRGAQALGVAFEDVTARVVEQLGGSWMTWEINIRVAEKVTDLPEIVMTEGIDGVFRMEGD